MKYKQEDFPSLEEALKGGDYEIKEFNGEVCITKYFGYDEGIFVPYGVTRIGEAAFKAYDYGPDVPEDEDYGSHDLERVIIPPTVKKIDACAFTDCECLRRVYIPASVVEMEGNPFFPNKTEGSPYLEIIEVEEGNPRYCSVDNCLIDMRDNSVICGGVDSKIPADSGVCKIGETAFAGRYIEELIIPEGVTEIGEAAFADCKNLEKVTLPSTLKKIGREAFARCRLLAEIILPEGIREIGACVFTGCSSLREMVWSANIQEIKTCTFSNCISLRKIILPKNLKRIDASAFFGSGIKQVELPEGLEFIGNSAFAKSSLENIKIPSGCVCDSEICSDCLYLKKFTVPQGWKEIPVTFFRESYIEEIEFSDNVEAIGISAFSFCSRLKKISLPETVKLIKEHAFAHSGLEELVISSGVREAEYSAFECCDGLKEVFIPKNIQKISHSLFYRCKNLKRVVIEDGVTEIGEHAFSCCYKLEEAVIPDSVKIIGKYAFGECKSLKEVSVSKCTKIADDAFKGCAVPKIDELSLMDMTEKEYKALLEERSKVKIKITRR